MKKKNLNRRQFITTAGAGLGTLFLGNVINEPAVAATIKSSDPFKKIVLGRTGIKTTLLGMGTGYSGYNRSSAIIRAGVAESLIRYAYDKGIRYFDCADSYGTNPYTASALKGIPRENYTIGTKMWITEGGIPEEDKRGTIEVINRFRKELKTDYIDIVQLHCITTGDWTTRHRRYMDDLEDLKAKKIILAHGLSVHSFEALETAAESNWVDVMHVRINPYGVSMDRKDHAPVVSVIEKLHRAGKGVIGMKLVGGGKFNDDPEKIDNSLNYVLSLGTVNMIIIGFEMPWQIDNYISRIRLNNR